MTTWRRTGETFCTYVARRRAARRRMLADAYRRAANRTSRTMADRLARHWRIDPTTVLAVALQDAAAGDTEARAWLEVCAPDRLGGDHLQPAQNVDRWRSIA